jgi:hypothetical protein
MPVFAPAMGFAGSPLSLHLAVKPLRWNANDRKPPSHPWKSLRRISCDYVAPFALTSNILDRQLVSGS